jgi:hypothetical protein
MENVESKPKGKVRILINPPPANLHCGICGRPFDELKTFPHKIDINDPNSCFRGNVVLDKEGNARLMKTFRGDICISASWECPECLQCSDIYDLHASFNTTEDPYVMTEEDHAKYLKAIDEITELAKQAIEKKELYMETPYGTFCLPHLSHFIDALT